MGVQTANAEVRNQVETSPQTRNPMPRLEQRAAFNLARQNGQSITVASKVAGISRRTGGFWEIERREEEAKLKARKAALVTKTELAEVYSTLLRAEDVDPRDKVTAGKAYAELRGLNEPTRTESTTLIVNASVAQWVEAQRTLAPAPTVLAIEAGGTPPNEAASNALSTSPTTPKNLGNGEEE